ncbi:MAG TPA: DUF1254 domain-containing protein [Gemmatimonadaceae bacterium]
MATVVSLACLIPISACGKATAEGKPAPKNAAGIAVDAYVYGYPLVMMDQTRRVATNVASAEDKRAPMGQFANMTSYPDASFRDVTAPNANTLYSQAWLDLSEEPYVLSLPDERGRYFLMPMLSGWTTVFDAPGKRTTGTGAQRYVIAGPHWKGSPNVPGATLVESPTNMVWLIGRTFAQETSEDLTAANQLQRQYTLVPLSAFGKPYTPPRGRVDPSIDMNTPVRDQVNALDAATFFDRLAMLMKENPPSHRDSGLVVRMASIGIVPGEPFDKTKLGRHVNAILGDLPKRAQERILSVSKNMKPVNGWQYQTNLGRYGKNYDLRAYTAYVGLGANLPQDAIYPIASVDGLGMQLDGLRNYVLHFDKGEQPPVKGFWSVTMYDPQYFFVENPLHRYQISPAQSPVKMNSDGSLDIYIQHQNPGAAKEKNWLPAPDGPFLLMLRMYWPEQSVVDGTWKPPGIRQMTSVAASDR